ncbi:hypothetical protein NOR51B_517 [Luminiphilus syltensis NOR5-1B]|uniref:Uncharacterized protein n=1 Tax=Luminiphilus syltensis NOR5-1B TaxID=565045 RepID=B8KVG5_9GAMM|nr:hypothetical protein NOR51B_517 [Luminiphilus syltensis NOR5-1B]
MGDTGAIRDANALAIDCRQEEALAVLDRAEASGGLSAYLAELEKVVFLLDLGREADAEDLLAQRNARVGATADDAAEARSAVEESLAELRKARKEKTGQATCTDTVSA